MIDQELARRLQAAVAEQHTWRQKLIHAGPDNEVLEAASRYVRATDIAYETACEIKGTPA